MEALLQAAAKAHPMSERDRKMMQDLIEGLEAWERQILEEYHVPPMKKDLACSIASIGDESLEGYEQRILDDYNAALERGMAARAAGSGANKASAENRQALLLNKFRGLIDRLSNNGMSATRIAEIVHAKLPAQAAPSLRTIRRWVAKYLAR
jgi:hypothetical protein